MYTQKQTEQTLEKLKRLERMIEPHLFEKVDEVEMKGFQTAADQYSIPEEDCFSVCRKGTVYQGEGIYAWFRGKYQVPDKLAGNSLFIWPRIQGYEGMLWVNGVPYGNFASKFAGSHYCDLLRKNVAGGEQIDIALEYYSGRYVIGTAPFEKGERQDFKIVYDGVDICLKREELAAFYFDLKIVNQMAAPEGSGLYGRQSVEGLEPFRRAEAVRTLLEIHSFIYYDFEHVEPEVFMESIRRADVLLREFLSEPNGNSAPYVGLIGHSHMDTAWLWTRRETEKKCARTYANQINLMDQYPEYTFMQSSAYHSETVRKQYPELFEEIRKRVAQGRYEPNGGVWIECDCNIPSGEYMIRQFVKGQRFTKKYFDYVSDTFWLPDTFGYSAALPQIMRGCGIRYFLTTKISWNDTNEFPYDTFYWKGIDGSRVLVHFNISHAWPDPATISRSSRGDRFGLKEKVTADMRLISYGFGDGGGGPELGMVEIANRVKDINGLPRTSHTTVSRFMKELEKRLYRPSTYTGELYLELHRGTLTNQHEIKRNNRKAEIALRDLEYMTVRQAVTCGRPADASGIEPLTELLLVNQFHDILPGTCIPEAHDDALRDVSGIIAAAQRRTENIMTALSDGDTDSITAVNSLSFERTGVIYLPFDGTFVEGAYEQQVIKDMQGVQLLAVADVKIPAFGSLTFRKTAGAGDGKSAFRVEGNTLETPFYLAVFDKKGYLEALMDKRNGRQIRGEGYALNTFLMAEEVSLAYDNWDVDADSECRYADTAELLSRQVVSEGVVEYRIRSIYRLTPKSVLMQDMVFYAKSPEIVFETRMDWQEEHRFLKAAFDTSIHADYANQEIQFGYIRRPVNRNTSVEKAKFEVSNHKYTDLSETRYGIAMLNDCKYGISLQGGNLHLSLHKGGNRPDYRGDKGIHFCTYALLPHMGSMDAENVIRPAYQLNEKPLIVRGRMQMSSLLFIDAPNVIAETIKPAEDAGNCFVIRLYEAEGTYTAAKLTFPELTVREIEETNMLEEIENSLGSSRTISLSFRPFEIKTLKVTY